MIPLSEKKEARSEWLQKLSQVMDNKPSTYRYLGGGFKIFLEGAPLLGKIFNLTIIFFRWVGEKPPPRYQIHSTTYRFDAAPWDESSIPRTAGSPEEEGNQRKCPCVWCTQKTLAFAWLFDSQNSETLADIRQKGHDLYCKEMKHRSVY